MDSYIPGSRRGCSGNTRSNQICVPRSCQPAILLVTISESAKTVEIVGEQVFIARQQVGTA
jgi:hypothetical protein